MVITLKICVTGLLYEDRVKVVKDGTYCFPSLRHTTAISLNWFCAHTRAQQGQDHTQQELYVDEDGVKQVTIGKLGETSKFPHANHIQTNKSHL